MKYFHVFISLFITIYLAAVRVMASHQAIHVITQLDGFHLSGHISCVKQQLINSRQNGKFRRHHVKSMLGSPMLSPVHSTIIITNPLFIQAESYYVITNFYLIWDRSQLLYSNDVVVITLDLSSTQVSCNNSDIILVVGCLTLVRIGWRKLVSSILLMTTEP